jgi:hypothetical protein
VSGYPASMRWPDLDGWLRLSLWLSWFALVGLILWILRQHGYF